MKKLFIALPYKVKRVAYVAVLVALMAAPLAALHSASAAATQALVRFDRMQTSTATTGTVCFKPATAGTAIQVQVTFPTGYTLGAAGTFTTSTTNLAWPTGGTAWPGIGTATAVAGQVVTFPSTTLTVGTLYCFNWTNSAAVTTAGTASSSNTGTITTQATGPVTIDTSSYVTATVTSDQIAVSASVPQSFSFGLSSTTDSLGAITTAAVTTSPSPRTVSISTNAKNGWMMWAKDAAAGLTSASSGYTIASTTPGSNSTLSAGTEGYNLGIPTPTQTSGNGTITVAAPFVGTAAGQGGGLNTAYAALVSSNGTANNAVVTLKNNASVASTTPSASDYADTETIVGAGLF